MPRITKDEFPPICPECSTSTAKMRRRKVWSDRLNKETLSGEYYACDCRRFSFSPGNGIYNDREAEKTERVG